MQIMNQKNERTERETWVCTIVHCTSGRVGMAWLNCTWCPFDAPMPQGAQWIGNKETKKRACLRCLSRMDACLTKRQNDKPFFPFPPFPLWSSPSFLPFPSQRRHFYFHSSFHPSIHPSFCPSITITHLITTPSLAPPSSASLLLHPPLPLPPPPPPLHPVHYVYFSSRPAYSAFSRLFHINIHGPHTYFSGTHIFRSRETTFFIFQHSTWKKTRIPCVWGAIAPSKKAASSPLARDCGMFNGKYPLLHHRLHSSIVSTVRLEPFSYFHSKS